MHSRTTLQLHLLLALGLAATSAQAFHRCPDSLPISCHIAGPGLPVCCPAGSFCGGLYGALCCTAEVCDGVDNDCDGVVDNGFLTCNGYCCPATANVCHAVTGNCCTSTPEVCDGVDNDCDGEVDNGCCANLTCNGACCPATADTCHAVTGACCTSNPEVCDGYDNDCDGEIDNGLLSCLGHCCPASSTTCHAVTGACCTASAEVCDGIDNDCDGVADNGCCPTIRCGSQCCGDDSAVCHPTTGQCCIPSPETCDGTDNNCNGTVDEGCPLGCDDKCCPGLVGDPVDISGGSSLAFAEDVTLHDSTGTITFKRSYSSNPSNWQVDAKAPPPMPFGASPSNPASPQWRHNFFSFVNVASNFWTVHDLKGNNVLFNPCSSPCTAQPASVNASTRIQLKALSSLEGGGFVVTSEAGELQRYQAEWRPVGAGPRRHFLTELRAPNGLLRAQLAYGEPPMSGCPLGASGGTVGAPYLESLTTGDGAKLLFDWRALQGSAGTATCVLGGIRREERAANGSVTTPVVVTYSYTESGGQERPGLLAAATGPTGAETYAYGTASFQQTLASGSSVTHNYGANGRVTSSVGSEEGLTITGQTQGTCVGSSCCGFTPKAQFVVDNLSGRGDGFAGSSGLQTRYETLFNAGSSGEPRLYHTVDSCAVASACSPGSTRYEWECSTPTMPGHPKATKDKKDHWTVYSYALPAPGPGVPQGILEKRAEERGASTMSGGDGLEKTSFAYSYGPNQEQQLAATEKDSVLQVGDKARTFQRYDSAGRLVATIQSGWTHQLNGADWSPLKRWKGTFYFTRRASTDNAEDSMGRVLEVQGPCWVDSEQATTCGPGAPLTQYWYWPSSEASNRRNRLQRVARYPSGPSSAPLETLYNDYTASGQVTESIDANGVATLYEYLNELLTKQTVRAPGQPDVVTNFGYDSGEHRTWIQYPQGNYEVFCYREGTPGPACAGGSMSARLQWKAKSASADGATWSEKTTYAYWPDGTVKQELYLDAAGSIRRTKSYAADAHRRPTLEKWGEGNGSFASTKAYDKANNLTGIGLPFKSPQPWCGGVDFNGKPYSTSCQSLAYDAADRLSLLDEYPSPSTAADRTCFRYDVRGNVTEVRSGCSSASGPTCSGCEPAATYQHDDFGNVVRVALPGAGATRFEYGAMGELLTKETPTTTANPVRFTYDTLGRALTAYHLDGAGQTELLYARGYDTSPSWSWGSAACGPAPSFVKGRVAYLDDSFGRTVYSYDAWGRVVREARARSGACDGLNATPHENPHTAYSYSPNGNLTSITYPYGRTVEYHHGTGALADRVASVSVTRFDGAAWAPQTVLSNVTWEPYGELSSYVASAGSGQPATQVEYLLGGDGSAAPVLGCGERPSTSSSDKTGRLRALWVSSYDGLPGASSTGNILKQNYTWRADQLVRQDTCLQGGVTPRTELFSYDGRLRLTGANRPLGNMALAGGAYENRGYSYSARGNMTTATRDGRASSFIYPPSPNVDKLQTVQLNSAGTALRHNYEYDAEGRVSAMRGPNALDGTSGWLAQFASGPESASPTDTVFRLAWVNGATYSYYYDAQGRRRLKQYPTGISDEAFHDIGNQLLVDRGNSDLDQDPTSSFHTFDSYLWLGGRPLAVIRGAVRNPSQPGFTYLSDATVDCRRNGESSNCGVYFLVTDYLGKPVLMLDSARRIVGTGEYDPYGHVNRVALAGETAHPFVSNQQVVLADFTQAPGGLQIQQRVRMHQLDFGALGDTSLSIENGTGSVLQQFGSATSATSPQNELWSNWHQTSDGRLRARFVGGAGQGNGASVEAYEYRRFQAGAQPFWTPLRFPGQHYDPETDLLENWNRYYDPNTGRYLSPEPLASVDPMMAQHNVYAYAKNNPLFYTDPNGLAPRVGPRQACPHTKGQVLVDEIRIDPSICRTTLGTPAQMCAPPAFDSWSDGHKCDSCLAVARKLESVSPMCASAVKEQCFSVGWCGTVCHR